MWVFFSFIDKKNRRVEMRMENNEENQVVLNFSTGSMKMLKEISVKENIPIDKMIEDL